MSDPFRIDRRRQIATAPADPPPEILDLDTIAAPATPLARPGYFGGLR